MNKDKILISVLIDKHAIIDRAFGISDTTSEFNELKKVIEETSQLTLDTDEFEDEDMRDHNVKLFANIALDQILFENQELEITKRANSLEDKKNLLIDQIKKLDELKEKVKGGEMSGVDGLRELFKIMEEGKKL